MRQTLAAAVGLAMLPALALSGPAGANEPTDPTSPIQQAEQFRGYWVDAFNAGSYSADQVTALVADAVDLGANALVVQTGRRFDCFCNDALYPRTDAGIAPAPYDPLAEVIRQAHAAGIEVHAWFNPFRALSNNSQQVAANHVTRSAPGIVKKFGSMSWCDPASEQTRSRALNVILDVVKRYDVDGVHLTRREICGSRTGRALRSAARMWMDSSATSTPR